MPVINGNNAFLLHGCVLARRLPYTDASCSTEEFWDEEVTNNMAARKRRPHVNKGPRRRKPRPVRADQATDMRQLLKPKDAARLLNVSEHTIRQWIWQKRLPVVRLGRLVRLCMEDLEAFINHHRAEEEQP
jgi:excisionase family DNA binding protein